VLSSWSLTRTQEEAGLLRQICNLSIIKKAKEDAGYVSFEKYNTVQFFHFNELQCLHGIFLNFMGLNFMGFSYFMDLNLKLRYNVYGRSFPFLTLQR